MPVALVDLAIITLIGFFAVRGIRRGAVRGTLDIVVLVVAVRSGAGLAQPLVPYVEELGLGRAAPAVALATVTMLVDLLCLAAIAIVGRTFRRMPIPPPLPFLDGLFGLAPGMVKGIVVATAVVVPLIAFQGELRLTDELRSSRLVPRLYALAQRSSDAATRQLGIELPTLGPTADPSSTDLSLP